MAPATGTAILVLAAFVLPGFVTLLLRERSYAIPSEQTPFERLLNALVYSAIIYGTVTGLGWLLGLVDKSDIEGFYAGRKDVGAYLLVAVLGVFVLPTAIALVGARWRAWDRRNDVLEKLGLSAAHGTRSGWDHFFGSNRRAFVRATLDDGRVLGGLFGYDSLAGYSQQSQDLFLEERWALDEEWFSEPAAGTLGLWLSSEHLVSLEFYELSNTDGESSEEERSAGTAPVEGERPEEERSAGTAPVEGESSEEERSAGTAPVEGESRS